MEKRMAEIVASGKYYSSDFYIRDRGPNVTQIMLVIFAVISISVFFTSFTFDQKLGLAAVFFILLGCVSWYATLGVRNNRDLVQATEFQNALFASAVGMNHDFTFIIAAKDKEIFYLNRPFQDVFTHFFEQDDRTLSVFFEYAGLSPENRQAFLSLIEKGGAQNLVLDMKPSEETFKAALSIEPIPRPQGFILVRGRKL